MNRIRIFSSLETKEISAVSSCSSRANKSLGRAGAVLTFIGMAISIGLSGCGSNSKAFSSPSANAAALVVTPSSVDFGDVKVGTTASTTVSVLNTGDSPVQVDGISSSNSAFTVSSSSLPATLQPGQSLTATVQYVPTTTTDSTGTLSLTSLATLSATSKWSNTIKIHGKGSNSGTAALSAVNCSSSSMIGAGTDNCTVTLTAAAPSTGLVVNLASSSSSIAVPASVTVASGATSAPFSAAVSAVTAAQTVVLTATQGTVSKSTSINLSGSGSPIAPSLSSLVCAKSTFTGAGSTTCTVSLSAAAPSAGQSVTLASNSTAVSVPSGISVPAGSSTASFTATISAVGTTQTANLTAAANTSSKAFTISLNATTAALSLSTTSLAFGNVSVNTAVTKSVTLTSSGTAAVTISSGSITGAGFTVSGSTLPITLNPGQSAVVSIQFYPTTASSVTGQLSIVSNASPATVSLSGTGTTVAPTVSGLSCSSSSVTGSLSDSCTVTLSGSAPSGGLPVALTSTNSSVSVPSSIVVPATATSATFTAAVAAVTSAQSATLTATTGSTSRSVVLQLNAATPALTVNASSISFGSVSVNNSTTQSVTITSSGTAAVTINSISVSGTGFSSSSVSLPAKLNPGQSIGITLTYNPTVVGSSTGQLAISSTSATNPTITVGLSGTATAHRVELSWNAPSSSGVTIAGYKVYRSLSGSGGFAALNSASAQTTYTDTGVQSGQAYSYYVTSVDPTGTESVPSPTTTVTIP